MLEQGLSVAFSEGDIMTPAGSTATIDVKVGSGVGTPSSSSQIDQRLATVVLESRNIMADVKSLTPEAPVTLAGGAPTLSTAPSSGTSITPETPLMGGLTLVTKDEWSAWTGGKPNSSWSGLDPVGGWCVGTHVAKSASPCLRFIGPERLQLQAPRTQDSLQAC